MSKTTKNRQHVCGAECRALQKLSRRFETHTRGDAKGGIGGAGPATSATASGAKLTPKSKAKGRRLVLEAQAQEDLLAAANAALAELARLDGLSTDRKSGVRPAAYLGLRNALFHLDALDR